MARRQSVAVLLLVLLIPRTGTAVEPPLTVLRPLLPETFPIATDELSDADRATALATLEAESAAAARSARARAGEGETLDLALALALIQHGERDDARALLERVTPRPGPPNVAAWTTLIALDARRRDEAAVLLASAELAERLQGDAVEDDTRQVVAFWLGRVSGGVRACTRNFADGPLPALETRLREAWRVHDDRATFEIGWQHAAEDHARLNAKADGLVADANREQDRLDVAVEQQYADAREKIRTGSISLRDDLLTSTGAIEERMQQLGEEVQYLTQRAQSLSNSIRLVQFELIRTLTVESARQAFMTERERRMRPGREQQRREVLGDREVFLQRRLQEYFREYYLTLQRRRTVLAVYGSTAGERSRQVSRFDARERSMTAAQLNLVRQEARFGSNRESRIRRSTATRNAAKLRREAGTLTNYVSLDVERAIEKLTETLREPGPRGDE